MKKLAAIIAVLIGLTLAGCAMPAEDAPPVQGADAKAGSSTESGKAARSAPIKLSAKRTTPTRSILDDGGPLSCVKVTVTNRTKKVLHVNPLYFSITDTGGTKHDTSSAMGNYEHQVHDTKLAPGENAKGVICAEGKFTPKTVSMTNELFDTAARAAVAS